MKIIDIRDAQVGQYVLRYRKRSRNKQLQIFRIFIVSKNIANAKCILTSYEIHYAHNGRSNPYDVELMDRERDILWITHCGQKNDPLTGEEYYLLNDEDILNQVLVETI